MFGYMSSILIICSWDYILSTLPNKESHSSLDTTDIICYKYKFVYIVIILKVSNVSFVVSQVLE